MESEIMGFLFSAWMVVKPFSDVVFSIAVITIISALGLITWKIPEKAYFQYAKMPVMSPVRIQTKGMSPIRALWLWISGVRFWELQEDFHFDLEGQQYFIPKGFLFNGVSVPKNMRIFISPTGILLLGALVHDYVYEFGYLPKPGGKKGLKGISRRECDKIFLNICIDVNGLAFINHLSYFFVRISAWYVWAKYKKTRGY